MTNTYKKSPRKYFIGLLVFYVGRVLNVKKRGTLNAFLFLFILPH